MTNLTRLLLICTLGDEYVHFDYRPNPGPFASSPSWQQRSALGSRGPGNRHPCTPWFASSSSGRRQWRRRRRWQQRQRQQQPQIYTGPRGYSLWRPLKDLRGMEWPGPETLSCRCLASAKCCSTAAACSGRYCNSQPLAWC